MKKHACRINPSGVLAQTYVNAVWQLFRGSREAKHTGIGQPRHAACRKAELHTYAKNPLGAGGRGEHLQRFVGLGRIDSGQAAEEDGPAWAAPDKPSWEWPVRDPAAAEDTGEA